MQYPVTLNELALSFHFSCINVNVQLIWIIHISPLSFSHLSSYQTLVTSFGLSISYCNLFRLLATSALSSVCLVALITLEIWKKNILSSSSGSLMIRVQFCSGSGAKRSHIWYKTITLRSSTTGPLTTSTSASKKGRDWIHLPGLQDATRLLVLGYSTLVGLWFNTLLFFIHMSRDLNGKFWKFKFANTGSRHFENICISTSEQCFIQGCVLLFCRFTVELDHINICSATGMFDIWWLSFCLCVLFVSLWNVVLILVTFVYGSCSYAITWIFFMIVSLWQGPRLWNSLPAALRGPVQQQSEDIFV